MTKKVFICAPAATDANENLLKAMLYTEFALKSGVSPIVPHFYILCVGDSEAERKMIESASTGLLFFIDEIWVFGNRITKAMDREIQFCRCLNVRVRFVKNEEVNALLGGDKV